MVMIAARLFLPESWTGDAKCSVYRLAVRQMHRSWVEQAIRDGKQELGMTQYQVRSWQAWQHHIALTMLAFLLIAQERIANQRNEPMLSCADIRDILTVMLPTKLNAERALLDMLNERHRRRLRDKERWRRLTLSG